MYRSSTNLKMIDHTKNSYYWTTPEHFFEKRDGNIFDYAYNTKTDLDSNLTNRI